MCQIWTSSQPNRAKLVNLWIHHVWRGFWHYFWKLAKWGTNTSRWWVATSIPFAGTGSWNQVDLHCLILFMIIYDVCILKPQHSRVAFMGLRMVLLLLYDVTRLKFIQILCIFLFKSEIFLRIFMTRCLAWIYQTYLWFSGFPHTDYSKKQRQKPSIFSQVKGLDIDQGLVLDADLSVLSSLG